MGGSKRIWEKIPLAAMTEEGPVMNRQWLLQMKGKFPNKMSRILLACDDGTERTGIAADFLNDEGYTAVQAIDGGIDQYLEEFPSRRRTRSSGRCPTRTARARTPPRSSTGSAPSRSTRSRAPSCEEPPLPPHRNNFLSPGFFI